MRTTTAIACFALLAFLPTFLHSLPIRWKLDNFGLAEVFYNDQPVLNASKNFYCFGLNLMWPNGTVKFSHQDENQLRTTNKSVDADGNGFQAILPDYGYHCRYSSPAEDEFLVSCTVSNRHPEASISKFTFALMRQARPPKNVTLSNYPPSGATGFDDTSFALIYSTGGQFGFAVYPTSFTIPNTVTAVTSYDYYSITSNWIPRKSEDYLPPGGSALLEYKFKFGGLNDASAVLGKGAYDNFRKAYPMTLNWPDRRPIYSHFMASTSASSAINPRGFFNDPLFDFVSEEGKANFKTRLVQWAQNMVTNMQKGNAQGMVLWDMEGNELPHAITYIGDPVNAEKMAPEIIGAIDEYFKIITDAGFKCGMTIRPQQMAFGDVIPESCQNGSIFIHYTGDWHKKGYTCYNNKYSLTLPYFQPPGGDPVEIMINKMGYAKARWGCTIFYVDSNAPPGKWAYTSDVHERVIEAVPGILVLPEQDYPRYFRSMAPYGEIDMNVWFANVAARNTYPNEAFSVVNVQDGTLHEDLVIESTLSGNIFLARGWFTDKRTTDLIALLKRVEEDHPYEVSGNSAAEGYTNQMIELSVAVSANRTTGITFDWSAEGAAFEKSYRQFSPTIRLSYSTPGTHTVDVIVRRGITEKTHTITVNVMQAVTPSGDVITPDGNIKTPSGTIITPSGEIVSSASAAFGNLIFVLLFLVLV